MGNVYGLNYLLLIDKEKQLRNITLVASLIGFVLSFPLIHKYQVIGVALVVTITRGILGIAQWVYVLYLRRT